MKKKPLTVCIAYAEWGSALRSRSLAEAIKCAESAKSMILKIVIVDNKLDCEPYIGRYSNRSIVVQGDSRAREFTAWDRAYHYIGQEAGWDAIIFANDTFVVHRRVWLPRRWRIGKWLRIAANADKAILFGQVDFFSENDVELPFGKMKKFIASYAFGVNAAAAKILFPLYAVEPTVESLLQDDYTAKGLFSEAISPIYRKHLEDWLFISGNWRNAAPLDEKNFHFMRLKAKAVIYEHSLVCRAASNGVAVHDLYHGLEMTDYIFSKTLYCFNYMAAALRNFKRKGVINSFLRL